MRHQATIAVSIYNTYTPFPAVVDALPPSSSEAPSTAVTKGGTGKREGEELGMITIQLENGIMCIRALKSGLLFVAIGGGTTSSSSSGRLGVEGGGEISKSPSIASLHAGSEGGSMREGAGKGIWGVRRWAERMGDVVEGKLRGLELSGEVR